MNTELLSNLLSGLIGAGSAIGVFYLQTAHDKKVERRKQNEKDSSTIEYLKISLEKTHKTIEEYIAILKNFNTDITKDPLRFPNADYLLFPYAERLAKKVDQNDIFFALRNKFNKEDAIKYYSIIYSVVDYIVSSLPEIYQIQDRAIEQDMARKLKYKQIVEKNIDVIATTGLRHEGKFGPRFSEDISSLLTSFFSERQDNTDFSYYQNNFVDKLKTYIIEKKQLELIEIATELKHATQIFESIKQHNLHHSKIIERFINQFQQSYDNLQPVIVNITIE